MASRLTFALKPMSWPKLLVPAFFGQALGVAAAGALSIRGVVFGALYVVTHLALVVLLNDWADRRVDAIKRAMFPATSSPKTIADSVLGERAVLALGIAALVACVLVSTAAERVLERPGFFGLGVAGIAVFLSYSFPPPKLNYRGGGELLEGFGVGYLLPALEAYLQSGATEVFASPLYAPTVLFAMSSAVASGLSDERSDLEGGKRTFVTCFGSVRARRAIVALAYAGAALTLAAPAIAGLHPAAGIAAIAVVAVDLGKLRALASTATTDAFVEQRALKSALHRVIWRATTVLGAAVIAQSLLDSSPP